MNIPVEPIIDLLEKCLPWQHGGVASIASLTRRVEAKGLFPAAMSKQGRENAIRRCLELANLHARGVTTPDFLTVGPDGELDEPRHHQALRIQDVVFISPPDWRR